MVKALWILSSRCRPRVGVEMSTLRVSDSDLGEGDEGGTGPGLGAGVLQCRPLVDFLGVGNLTDPSDCCSWPVLARTLDQRHSEAIIMVDKVSVSNPLAEAFLRK